MAAVTEKVLKGLRLLERFGVREGTRLGWQITRGSPAVLEVRDPSGLRYQTPNDRSQAYHLTESTPKLLAMVNRLQSCASVLDIGANVGLFSLAVRRRFPAARVVCVEADPELARLARANLGDDPAITVVARAAVEDDRSEVSLHVSCHSNQIGSLLRGAVTPYGNEIGQKQVPAIGLRNLFSEFPDSRVDVLKVDIQGYEHRLLAPHADLLERVGVCFLEVTFLDPDTLLLLGLLRARFPNWQIVNRLLGGADLMFWR